MRYEDDAMAAAVTNRDLPFLSTGLIGIRKRQGQWVEENRRRLVERYAVLLKVGLGLRCIPLIDHSLSLPQPIARHCLVGAAESLVMAVPLP